MSDWKLSTICCGNCAFWPLAGYQHDWKGAEPLGCGGPGTDGSISECRRRAPIGFEPARYPSRTAIFPETNKRDHCGDFEAR